MAQMSASLKVDTALVTAASEALARVPPNDGDHTVAAAARSVKGEVHVGINVFHFTGGPCAELVALGVAAASGVLAIDLATMVAVRRDRDSGQIQVLNPCGRCRQVMLDYNPELNIVVLDEKGRSKMVGVKELLPYAYVYGDLGGEEEAEEVALA